MTRDGICELSRPGIIEGLEPIGGVGEVTAEGVTKGEPLELTLDVAGGLAWPLGPPGGGDAQHRPVDVDTNR